MPTPKGSGSRSILRLHEMTWRSIFWGIALKNQVRQNTVHDHQNSGHNPPAALGWGPSRMGCAKAGGSCACACGSGPCMRLRPMRLRRSARLRRNGLSRCAAQAQRPEPLCGSGPCMRLRPMRLRRHAAQAHAHARACAAGLHMHGA